MILDKIFLDVTKSVHADGNKWDYKLHQVCNSKKLINQAMETVLHAITVRKRLWHENGVHICFSIGEMSDYCGKYSVCNNCKKKLWHENGVHIYFSIDEMSDYCGKHSVEWAGSFSHWWFQIAANAILGKIQSIQEFANSSQSCKGLVWNDIHNSWWDYHLSCCRHCEIPWSFKMTE